MGGFVLPFHFDSQYLISVFVLMAINLSSRKYENSETVK